MRKFNFFFALILPVLLASCVDTVPKVYTSISGSWRCEEYNRTTGITSNYLVEIDRQIKDTTQYVITYFENTTYDDFIFVHLTGKNITIPTQQIGTKQMEVRTGSGVVSADFKRIDWDYTVYNGITEVIQAAYTR